MNEQISLTISPIKGVSKEPRAQEVRKEIWEKLTHWPKIEFVDNEEGVEYSGRQDGSAQTEIFRNWEYWHCDVLRFSVKFPQVLFTAVCTRPELREPFKVFYLDGRTRICGDPAETFDAKLLI